MISILAFTFSIVLLVFIHELGHYLAARSVGVKVEKFYIGFNIFGYSLIKRNVNGTEYGIGWLPIGGYVKLAGMIDESLDPSSSDVPKENQLRYQPAWAKVWVMSAGVIMNFLLATFIFTIMLFKNGIPEPMSDQPLIAEVVENYYSPNGEILKESAAYLLGLQAGDQIIKVDSLYINTWDDLSSAIHSKPNEKIYVEWLHNNEAKKGTIITDTTRTIIDYKIKTIGILGINRDIINRELNVIESIYYGFKMMTEYLNQMIFSLYALIIGNVSIEDLSGPVGIAQIAGNSARAGIESLFFLIAILSINLGLVNILPIPALDGGHIFITLVEALIGRELSLNVKMIIQQIGILVLLSLFIFIMFNDISKIFN